MRVYGDNLLVMTKGDLGVFQGVHDRPFEPGETVIFRAAKSLGEEAAITITGVIENNNEVTFTFTPSDTENLSPGLYLYDIRIEGGSNGPITVVPYENPDTGVKRTLKLKARVGNVG